MGLQGRRSRCGLYERVKWDGPSFLTVFFNGVLAFGLTGVRLESALVGATGFPFVFVLVGLRVGGLEGIFGLSATGVLDFLVGVAVPGAGLVVVVGLAFGDVVAWPDAGD